MSDITRRPKTPPIILSVTLRDGTTHSFPVAKTPRAWRSWVMRQLPYGTSFQGAQFSRRRIAD